MCRKQTSVCFTRNRSIGIWVSPTGRIVFLEFLCHGRVSRNQLDRTTGWAAFTSGCKSPDAVNQAGKDHKKPKHQLHLECPFSPYFRCINLSASKTEFSHHQPPFRSAFSIGTEYERITKEAIDSVSLICRKELQPSSYRCKCEVINH